LRVDATINSKDIALFLRSRYGLVLDRYSALDIAQGLTGTYVQSTNNNDSHPSSFEGPPSHHHGNGDTMEETAEQIIMQQFGFQGRDYGYHTTGEEGGGEEEENRLHYDSTYEHHHIFVDKRNGNRLQTTIKNLHHNFDSSAFISSSSSSSSSHHHPHLRTNNRSKTKITDYDTHELLDLVHLYSSLLIPTLLKATKDIMEDFNQATLDPLVTDHVVGMISPTLSSYTTQTSLLSLLLIQAKTFILSLPDVRLRMKEAKDRQYSLRVQPSSIISDVLRILLATNFNVVGSDTRLQSPTATHDKNDNASETILLHELSYQPHGLTSIPSVTLLTKDLLRQLLLQYGEREVMIYSKR